MQTAARNLSRTTIFGLGLVLSASTIGTAHAEDAAAKLDPGVRTMLEKAASRDSGANLQAVTLIAIEANPAHAADILATVASIAPAKEPAIRKAAADAFPGLKIAPPAPKERSGLLNPDGWKGSLELSANRSTGNTEQTTAAVIGKAIHESGDWTHKLNGLFDFERTDNSTSKRRWLAGYDINYTLSDGIYMFGSLLYENDRFAQIDYRLTEAAGIGYRVIRRKNLTFNIEAGSGARQTKFLTGLREDEFTGLGRTALVWRITDTASFSHDLIYLLGADQQTLDTTAALKLRIIGALSGQFSYNYRYNSAPPLGTRKVDTVTRAGIVYDF